MHQSGIPHINNWNAVYVYIHIFVYNPYLCVYTCSQQSGIKAMSGLHVPWSEGKKVDDIFLFSYLLRNVYILKIDPEKELKYL